MPVDLKWAVGADVSHYHPVTDWGKLSGAVSFLGIKATEGNTHTDSTLKYHRDQGRIWSVPSVPATPMEMMVYYHFARSGSPVKQAEFFMRKVGELKPFERLALDLEVFPDAREKTMSWVDSFYKRIWREYPGVNQFIYTSFRIWQEMDMKKVGGPDWEMGRTGLVKLWAPRYNLSAEPLLPTPWKNSNWLMWQWSDGTTPPHIVPGIGACDSNYFRGVRQDLREFVNGPKASSTLVA